MSPLHGAAGVPRTPSARTSHKNPYRPLVNLPKVHPIC